MAEPFVGEIRLFSFNKIPSGWQPCNGQLLPINRYAALFALLGPVYGGDGKTTFALPDLRGRVALHVNAVQAAVPMVRLGESNGEKSHELTISELPSHTHSVTASLNPASSVVSTGNTWAVSENDVYTYSATSNTTMSPNAIAMVGGGQPHNNMQPYVALSYCIAITGIFPPHQ